MIAQPLAGSQRPRPSAAAAAANANATPTATTTAASGGTGSGSGSGTAPARNRQTATSHYNQAAIGSNAKHHHHQQQQPQPIIDLTDDDRGSSSSSDRPAKRQKLDHLRIGGNTASAAGGRTSARDGSESRSPSVASMSKAFPPFPFPSVVRGPPAWSFEDAISSSSNAGSGGVTGGNSPAQQQQEISTAKQEAPPALPIRPWKYACPDRQRKGASKAKEELEDREVRITPYRLSPPPNVPRFKNNRVTDFAPWTGIHPEDALTDQTAKQGYYDRIQVSQNESNTARPSLYAQFKHRSGLQVLSSVFATALDKRQSHCKVTAPSTFKPPPRVTLTDIKREAWLRDLANLSVPLRRLSRTIPHGIRGKVLLEQCLSKSVPMGRALWLAKCVGANEIRAFKRKGTSGAFALGLETKWVRDWTTNVQQFVDGIVERCGEPDWKSKITYVVRLAARLYSEHLLDQDHYLEWFLYSLDAASLDKMPIWLLMMGIYWDSLIRYRKRSRRLAEVLLEKLRLAREKGEQEILAPLVNRLYPILRRFMQHHPSSFIIPHSWNKFESTITYCLDFEDPAQHSLFESLSIRNRRVQKPKAGHTNAQRSPEQRIIRLLDATSTNPKCDITTLAVEASKLLTDKCSLISKVLEWAATSFRLGVSRIYVAVRLMRRWKKVGIDIDSHILTFLKQCQSKAGLLMENVYHVISELVRSQTFSTGRYLQWLMARGVVDNTTSGSKPSGDIQLLAQLPSSRLPEHLWSLRNTLLRRAGFSISGEVETVQRVKTSLRGGLPSFFYENEADGDTEMGEDMDLASLSWTIKSEIGQWIRQGVASHYKDVVTPADEKAVEVEESALTPEEFYHIRDILERLGDLSMLADILNHASNSNNTTVLASAVDTVNYHLDSFCVIGAAQDLFKRYVEAYTRSKSSGGTPKELLTSLLDLGVRLPSEVAAVHVLCHDLVQESKKAGVPASSPVSDHLMESINHANPTFLEELDQLFSSGDRMDESTMVRIFETLVKGLSARNGKGVLSADDTCRYLAQLRTFNTKQFDLLLVRWVAALLKSSSKNISSILVPLIGVGCISLHPLFILVKRIASSGSKVLDMAALRLDLLQLLGPNALNQNGPLDLVAYRFRLFQKEYLSTHLNDVHALIQDAISTLSEGRDATLQHELNSSILPILRDLILRHPDVTSDGCMKSLEEQSPASKNAVRQTLNLLLASDSDNDNSQGLSEAVQAIQLANDFSIRFCQLKLRLLCMTESTDETKNAILDIMFRTAVTNVRSGTSHWVDLISILGQDAARQIREKAEERFLSAALSKTPVMLESTGDTNVECTSKDAAVVYLSIVEELAYSIPESGVPSIEPLLFDKMNVLLHRVFASDKSNDTASSLLFWFSTLLRLCVMHLPTQLQTSAPKPGTFDPSRLLILICCIALSPLLSNPFCPSDTQQISSKFQQNTSALQTHALDIASSILDSIPDESRHQCIRFLRDRLPPPFHVQNDSRLLFLFGPVTDSLQSPQPPPQPQSQQQQQQAAAASTTPAPTPLKDDNPVSLENRLYVQSRNRGSLVPYHLRAWEMLEEAAPIVGANDTAVGLGYFGARRSRG